ncbi:aminomethyl-transferring glycine dehydrogenase [Rhizosphaericola mali]|uniref:Glycine dehydrogenase (decarboxylating) n=1 Tax=Rhizosphaericola mali TaxID=2545455 RepID=A0A5P2G705_9BACT|nr:aminomethyl-transferring glycine dehydrogenase [Rhizosphaericola mali]QES89013.1 aminomethyl-transferring glycine dehydrogenase [Rhizosphaericola mali]
MNLFLEESTEFQRRHIGPNQEETKDMLATIGISSIKELIDKTIPESIRLQEKLDLPSSMSEFEYLQEIKAIASKNKVFRSYIGQGYYNTITPSVILRNVYENPAWYTSYTPYQAEISQGRLESLLNYQTVVADLTGLEISNASLLDEATSAAEGMSMLFHHVNKNGKITKPKFFVDEAIFAQTKDVLKTRAFPIHIELVEGDYKTATIDDQYFGAIVQYPNSNGSIEDYSNFIEKVHGVGGYVVMATDLLALTLLKSPGALGADVAVGNSQRFGVPMGFGGPHAGFFATKDEFKRAIPGRIIGVSIDSAGNRALRLALQTREQHIKRDKATSNICTAQALLANIAAMYAVYHGPKGLKEIAQRVAILTQTVAEGLRELGYEVKNETYFDTIHIIAEEAKIRPIAEANEMNFFYKNANEIILSLDETTSQKDTLDIVYVFANALGKDEAEIEFDSEEIYLKGIPTTFERQHPILSQEVFNHVHSETQMMRYIKNLEKKDIALNTSMISLGSCTMKLNAATEMIPTSWPEFAAIHPFAPANQTEGYKQVIDEISHYLSVITGFDACSLQPNSGAQGEFSGLNTIMQFHIANGQENRNVVLIPLSAHGTNPASGVMAGMKVVVVKSDDKGQIDIEDLREKAEANKENLGALMVTYPSTYGIYEEGIREICEIIHANGGQVYMDGANMNAQVGHSSPGFIGADVCHLNLHKTFAIPHGGGGPGVGPICCKAHLAPYLPGHVALGTSHAVSAAPFGSANILLISYAYIKMLGLEGLTLSTKYAILNANYMKSRLEKYYHVLFTGKNNTCAHEFMVDIRPIKASCGISAEDVAKRLMDFGFHAPTVSFPVVDALMIEPTESEDKAELDRFCDAMISIFKEIESVENGSFDKTDNVLKNAPHTQFVITADHWDHTYSRTAAAYPLEFVAENKFWPTVGRINNTQGDRNLICTCEPIEAYL